MLLSSAFPFRLSRPHPAGTAFRSSSVAAGTHPMAVLLLACLWMGSVCNIPLWREVLQLPGAHTLRGGVFALAFLLEAPGPSHGLCGEARFDGPATISPVCALRRGGLACSSRKKR